MKAAFYTLGCKVNRYESQAMSELLRKNGYGICDSRDAADVYIINSCTVTAQADQKTRQAVRRFKKLHPDSIVVLCGCMPQAYPDRSELLAEADIIIGNRNHSVLPALLDEFLKNGKRIVSVPEHKKGDGFSLLPISCFDERTRAYLKIQDGCDRFCSYCIIPTSRGRVRSKPVDEIKKEVAELVKNGFREIVLVGINLSAFGTDIGSSFPAAIEAAASVEGVARIRLGSLEPDHFTDEVIERLSKIDKLCPQFHLSLQSGCDKTLKAMNRHYSAEEYALLADKLRHRFKGCALTTDVMVGFPGEDDGDFEESLRFVKKIAFEKVHVFPYSVRKGTKAEKLPGQIPERTKAERCRIMICETDKIRRSFFSSLVGDELEVLVEGKDADGFPTGHSRNYTPVHIMPSEDGPRAGEIKKVRIVSVGRGDFVIGELI